MSFAVMTNNVQFNADNTPTLTIGIQQQPIGKCTGATGCYSVQYNYWSLVVVVASEHQLGDITPPK